MRYDRHSAVVVAGGGGYHPGAQGRHQRGEPQPVVEPRAGLQAQHPGGAVEQVRVGGTETGHLASGHRVSAHEARAGAQPGGCEVVDRPLDRGHVGDQAGVAGRGQFVEHRPDGRQRYGHGYQFGGVHGVGQRARYLPAGRRGCLCRSRPGGRAGGRVEVVPEHPVPGRRERTQQRTADEAKPDHGSIHGGDSPISERETVRRHARAVPR